MTQAVARYSRAVRISRGLSLLELLIVITVLTVAAAGVVPLVKTTVRRHRERRLREALAEMRGAIREFRRDAAVMPCPGEPFYMGGGGQAQASFIDPRSRVVISDCALFGPDNPDRFPPTLETLVEGVNVVPRGGAAALVNAQAQPTDNKTVSARKKIYLRAIPVDPTTGRAEWSLRSSYDAPDSADWGGENVFDVRSKSTAVALNGEKYSEW